MRTHRTRTALTGLAAAVVLGLSGCGDDEPVATGPQETADDTVAATEDPVDEEIEPGGELTEPAFEGDYTEDFIDRAGGYTGEQVTLRGTVGEVLQPGLFTLTSTEDTSAAPILVIGIEAPESIDAGTPAQVTGTLMEGFEVTDVEDQQGVDLDDPLFEQYSGQPYLNADSVELQEDPDA
ncbi:hypothetical protein ACI8AC_06825 [Geodermatophilus sp. SYSU D00758]